MWKEQVFRVHRAAHHIGKRAKRCTDQYHRHDHETIEAVGEIHRVARTDDHEIRHRDKTPRAKRIADRFEERQHQVGTRGQAHRQTASHPRHEQVEHARVVRLGHAERKVHGREQANRRLPEVLFARRHAARVLVHNLAVVIDPTDHAVTERDEHHDPYESIGEISPQQSRKRDAQQNQHTTHGRRARLHQMRLRTVRAHGLTDFQLRQFADHPRAANETDEQRRDRRADCAEREVGKHAQKTGVILKPLRECE